MMQASFVALVLALTFGTVFAVPTPENKDFFALQAQLDGLHVPGITAENPYLFLFQFFNAANDHEYSGDRWFLFAFVNGTLPPLWRRFYVPQDRPRELFYSVIENDTATKELHFAHVRNKNTNKIFHEMFITDPEPALTNAEANGHLSWDRVTTVRFGSNDKLMVSDSVTGTWATCTEPALKKAVEIGFPDCYVLGLQWYDQMPDDTSCHPIKVKRIPVPL